MAIELRASSAVVGGKGTSYTVTVPASVQVGDLLILVGGADATGWPTPAGWTLVDYRGPSWNIYSVVFMKIAEATDPGASVVFTRAASQWFWGGIMAFSGLSTTPLFQGLSYVLSGYDSSKPRSVQYRASSGSLIVGFGSFDTGTNFWTSPELTQVFQGLLPASNFEYYAGYTISSSSNPALFNFQQTPTQGGFGGQIAVMLGYADTPLDSNGVAYPVDVTLSVLTSLTGFPLKGALTKSGDEGSSY